MAEFQSILQCISPQVKQEDKKDAVETSDELTESDEKELSEIVEDLLSIQKPDILKRNITNLVKENLLLKKKVSSLESQAVSKPDPCLSFQIDCDGLNSVEDISSSQAHIQYNPTEVEVMGGEKAPTPPAKTGSNCWNCGGGHNLAECKEERDHRKIGKNRREFMNKNGGMNNARYHVDDPQKYGHLAPGIPSKKLSEALGLRRDHLPAYIYKLRELGYPPGWLKSAEISESGMALYLEEGRKVDTGEEGEVVEAGDKMEYDTKKLVSWPGFNTDIPKHYRDESDRYRVRSMAKVYSLRDMKREMRGKEQKAYKKGKMQDVSTDNLQPADMETEDGTEDGANNTIDLTESDPGPPGDDTEEDGEIEREVTGDDSNKTETPIKQLIGSGNVAKTDTGTPIVELHSPFDNLPKYANFGKDMTEHIVFENLPDYTGTWDKMSGLIQRIRKRKDNEEEKDF
eukprot:TRINITY_DN7519_c0_g1_i1.p1 TRINITY_DN7519_c0_g1~~TRINITY_DN7519_c0_g1_i1.p1  ORF type:complete len:457 (-),score=180.01 TRINITY_DN7519_c0_g1_i1:113-1483(-)